MKIRIYISALIVFLLILVLREGSGIFSFQGQEPGESDKILSERVINIDKDRSLYDLGAGRKKLVIQSGQKHYDSESGVFRKRDNKFYVETVGKYTDKVKNDFLVRINRNSLIPYKIEKDRIYVVFEAQDVNSSSAEIIDNTALYRNVWDDVDVKLEINNNGIKEYLIINSSASDTVFKYKVISNSIFFDNGKGISFLNEGKRIFYVPAPESFDKLGKKVDVSYSIYEEDGFYYLEFNIGRGYEYPVIVDPRIIIDEDSKIEDAYMNSTSPYSMYGNSNTILLGSYSSTNSRWNMIVRMKDHGIPSDAVIDSAFLKYCIYDRNPDSASDTMYIKGYNVREGRDWVESQVCWANWKNDNTWTAGGALDTDNDIYGSESILDTIVYTDNGTDSTFINITDLLKKWVGQDSVHPNQGMMFRRSDYSADSLQLYIKSKEGGSGSLNPAFIVYYRCNLVLNLQALSDSSIECLVDTSVVGHVDSFIIMRSIDSSAISDVFYSLKDTLDTLTTATEYSLIAGGYDGGTLKYYSDPDSIYTLALIPDSPFVQSWTTTSIRIKPERGENPADVKLAIYDSTLQKYLNSSGDTVSSAVWQTEAQWDTLVAIKKDPNTEYVFGVFAKNGDDSITAISDLKSCKTNSIIDSIKVYAITDSSYIIYFGGDSVYSPFKGYFAIDDSDSSTVSDTIDVFSYGIKSIVTNSSYLPNTFHRYRILRIENQADSLYYSDADSAYTLTATPTPPVISGTSDSTFLLQFDDVSGNPDTIKYAIFDSVYSLYRDTTGDTTGTIVFATDVDWDNLIIKTYTPNLFVAIGIFGKNDDSVFSAVSSDTTWTWAAVPGTTMVSVIDSTRLLIKIDTNKNPEYTYFAVEDSISEKFIDINTGILRSSGVEVDSTWAFGRYSDWGGSEGFIVTVTPKTNYYFRAYSKDGNTNP